MSANPQPHIASSNAANLNHQASQENLVGDYIISSKIGQGSFATVYKAQHKTTNKVVAIKSVLRSKLTKKLLENLESEISILKGIRHPHIVGLIECQKTDTHIYLVMEYCSMGDLSQYIKQKRTSKSARRSSGGLSERLARHFLKQLADALQFLRSRNLVHRDIKPQNLLLIPGNEEDPDSNMPLLKVADFGFARFLPNATLADTLCGSPLYMGPEILSYQKYDAKADLWSVGAVLYEMVTGRPPFRAQNHLELLKKIQENKDHIRFPDEKPSMNDQQQQQQYPSSYSATTTTSDTIGIGNDLKDLIRKLLKKDPVERITFDKFFMHQAVTSNFTSVSPSPSVSTSSARVRRSPEIRPSSMPATATNTTMSNNHHIPHHHRPPSPSSSPYEPPPFAQQSPTTATAGTTPRHHFDWRRAQQQQQHQQQTEHISPGRMSPGARDISGRTTRGDESPLHSRGRSWRNQQQQNDQNRPPWMDVQDNTSNVEDELKDYVVLDRRAVETNHFADEINASPRTSEPYNQLTYRYSPATQVAIPQRGSHEQQQQLPSPSSTGSTPPFAITPRERKISAGSAGSALAKALSMASVRLFGPGNSPPKMSGRLQQQQQQQQQAIPGSPRGFLITEGGGYVDPQEGRAMKDIERAACMAHAVARFADSKYDQLVSGKVTATGNEVALAEEAMVLHIKALSLLELGLSTARQLWGRMSDDTMRTSVSTRLNDAVQWMRERFNECLDRASFEGTKCDGDSNNQNGIGACVAKLLYDRALEMSRAAAVYELVGENIPGCEHDYQTAIWMLEAILEAQDDDTPIEEDDFNIINKFIGSIRHRISVLRKKKELDARRDSDLVSHHHQQQQRYDEQRTY
ncbi:kinase-like domain-containing protein [Zychaea mexicana]|uniref:kinase-like domain-containing protein n=1 Tax=Zychaea mexicana TaxID=64656 RepID=UPI0022FE8D8E|nr:kinase-like domain-containing protein [Zychaea mexicana]KAI9484757.1 kinase-like domain-containing protein [Zychaea mexicana]